jgi:predicted homoserine dehydrogenase-like protein
MIHKLRELQASGGRIRVGVIGCGAMGTGVAGQVAHTIGMEVVFLGDLDQTALDRASGRTGMKQVKVADAANPPARAQGEVLTTTDPLTLMKNVEIDALVECTNGIYDAAKYCLAAIDQGAHIILMNAEVDLVFGTLLAHEAKKKGVIVTSDAGDQHGVLATMADEIQVWGFKIMQAGNMKGFLYRHADAAYAKPWAEKQKGSVVQTVSYTDGTKMNVEQALIGNYLGLTPIKPGMEGPKCKDLKDVLNCFDFDAYDGQGRVDYTEGVPWPGGGVYIVGHCDDEHQDFLLNYYKVTAKRPYYLFFRPYHLCHIETPRAIAQAYFDKRPVIPPPLGRKLNDVYVYAKQDLRAGATIGHAIGGDEVYGMIRATADAEAEDAVPFYWLESIDGRHAKVKNAKKRDEALRFSDLDIPESDFHVMLRRQAELAAGA